MPTIAYFLGIAIQMYYDDHPPPHIHVKYNEHQARLPSRRASSYLVVCQHAHDGWSRNGSGFDVLS